MQTSESGRQFIVGSEGTCLTIRSDNRGPQIGHGHDLSPAEIASNTVYGIYIGAGITGEQADFILQQDLDLIFDPAVNRQIPARIVPTQNQFDALSDFCYNEGPRHLATMMHHGWAQIPAQIPAWHFGEENGVEVSIDGLVARRAKEVALFTL
jgi:GH24 family phage-related lysozyme (muramidase)